MASREAILESLIFALETQFLGCPVRISKHPKNNFSDRPLFYGFRDIRTALGRVGDEGVEPR